MRSKVRLFVGLDGRFGLGFAGLGVLWRHSCATFDGTNCWPMAKCECVGLGYFEGPRPSRKATGEDNAVSHAIAKLSAGAGLPNREGSGWANCYGDGDFAVPMA